LEQNIFNRCRKDTMALQIYIPERGDLVHLSWYPNAGREMTGDHYGLVLSPRSFNKTTGLALICPATSDIAQRKWAFAVRLRKGTLPPKRGVDVDSALLVDQTKSLDYRARGAKKIAVCPKSIMDDVTEIFLAVLDPQAY
jgi:mRNA interferase MazF